MFGLGIWEIVVIALVALIVLGPEKLPQAAKSLGKALYQFRRASDDIRYQVLSEIEETKESVNHPAISPPTQTPLPKEENKTS